MERGLWEMEDLQTRIVELQKRIRRDTVHLARLKQSQKEYEQQLAARAQYLSSKEILALIREHCGQSCSMTTIKRWADEGFLGEVLEERKLFPGLGGKRGNKRFLYHKPAVYRFLYQKGLLQPRYEVLDRVRIDSSAYVPDAEGQTAVVIAADLSAELFFVYTVQVEMSSKIVREIPEHHLSAAREKR
ncbi:hypothetical protein LOK74_07375 [Brevibacillus humidisoli]|uniref:hypothetical protein n=1 Tax=Brevibacillus humidisoli TaxID=2895522 RepID=UPI001E56EBC4|nr:hypothetical protein [Brevibacillus humidisoli]UFJ42301.1 hypothetical protein LOK74_07375 [Brevibacillus humidisoli]